jgi:hypothetical protein
MIVRYGDMRGNIRRICGDAVADQCKPVWGLDKEGEFNGVWRDIGVRGLWYMTGSCWILIVLRNKWSLMILLHKQATLQTVDSIQDM